MEVYLDGKLIGNIHCNKLIKIQLDDGECFECTLRKYARGRKEIKLSALFSDRIVIDNKLIYEK